jgi:hypothetical protein
MSSILPALAQRRADTNIGALQAGGDAFWDTGIELAGAARGACSGGGFQSERDAGEALERALERLRRANGTASTLTLATLVKEYLAQHDAQPETIEKLRWLLAK